MLYLEGIFRFLSLVGNGERTPHSMHFIKCFCITDCTYSWVNAVTESSSICKNKESTVIAVALPLAILISYCYLRCLALKIVSNDMLCVRRQGTMNTVIHIDCRWWIANVRHCNPVITKLVKNLHTIITLWNEG